LLAAGLGMPQALSTLIQKSGLVFNDVLQVGSSALLQKSAAYQRCASELGRLL
jgi:hypothetical protein